MKTAAQILVATDAASNAKLIKALLNDEFDRVAVSIDPELGVQDVDKYRPAVLVLAFDTLEKAQRYYLGLYRLGALIHTLPHRTIILCNKDELRRVYELCRKEYFDDYVLFWPMAHDAPRLCMAVHGALRQMADNASGAPSTHEFAAQARRIAELEFLLQQSLERGRDSIEAASRFLQQAERDIDAPQNGFLRGLSDGARPDLVEIKDRAGFLQEIERLAQDQMQRRSASIAAAVQPIRQWAGAIPDDLAAPLESARALQALAERVRPLVLIVDDDEFQHKLLQRLLVDAKVELAFAISGAEALAMLRKRRPNLVLMDIHLPGIDGVEVTRRLKAAPQFADIPVVMITGQSEKEVVMQSMQAGAADFLVKPFEREILLSKVLAILAGA